MSVLTQNGKVDGGVAARELTPQEMTVLAEKAASARIIARKHFEIEPGMKGIYTIYTSPEHEASPETPIKLLEVNEDTFPTGVLPLGFDAVPTAGIHFPSIIVTVTPAEFIKIRSHELPLPEGWTVGEALPGPNGAPQ